MTREEALKIVSNIYQTDKEKEALGVLIPELAESEDERARKELILYFNSQDIAQQYVTDEKRERWVSYLEKLKEQKPVEIEEIIRKAKSEGRQEVIDNPEYYQLQKPAEWSEEDKQWLSEVYSAIDHSMYSEIERQAMKKYIDYLRYQSQQKTTWNDEDSDNLERVDNYLWLLDNYIGDDCATPQGKADKIRENIQKVLSPWIKSLPERFNLQQKQELDEDERIRHALIEFLREAYSRGNAPEECAKWIVWLDRPKEQKPCEDSGTEGDIMQYIEEGEKRGVKEVISFPEKYGLQKKQKPAEWGDEDEKNSAFIVASLDAYARLRKEKNNTSGQEDFDKAVSWIHDRLGFIRPQPKQELDEESSKVVLKAVELLNSYGNSLYNGSFEKESNAVYKVADSLKLLSTQPKPEWSENERQRLKTIAGYLRYKGYEEDAEFIESIPPQQKEEGIKGVKGHPDPAGVWKPSDGQLKALKYFLGQHRLQMDASTTQWEEYDNLRSLYDILCKIAKS